VAEEEPTSGVIDGFASARIIAAGRSVTGACFHFYPLTGVKFMDLPIRGEQITLAQALKIANVVSTGGHAKFMIREGDVSVNGQLELRPGRKLADNDLVQVQQGKSWTIRMQTQDPPE
jgi:ribosome-associated protein